MVYMVMCVKHSDDGKTRHNAHAIKTGQDENKTPL